MYNHRRKQTTASVQSLVLCSTVVLQLLHGHRDLDFVASFFVPSPAVQNTRIRTRYPVATGTTQQQQTGNGEEPDLFDYFDPLLSPHAYPNGIGASATTNDAPFKSLVRYDEDEEDKEKTAEKALTDTNPRTALQGDDLGWGSNSRSDFPKKSYQLKKPFGISLPGSDDDDEYDKGTKPKQVSFDTSVVFDPTLSPHMYTNGFVPEVIIGDDVVNSSNNENMNGNVKEAAVIGILLMDHGSRNAASNERLQELAQLYQQQFATATASIRVVVKAAHMEIAAPSIEDGLSALLQENVQEIICHPYFLSPGRHVVEDIPQLVQAAIQTLSISIPVKTTRPIGSETSIMISAINSLVKETSEYLQKK